MVILVIFMLSFLFVNGITLALTAFYLIGLIVFIFSEYITHRFLFHLKPPKNTFFLKMLKRLHYDHHAYPNELHLLFLPLWYSLPNFMILAAIFFSITKSFIGSTAFGAGLITMLLIYEWKHYIAHTSIKPRTALGKWFKKLHILHHYKNEKYWFGVSNPFVDVLFGTLKNEKDVKTSQTAKNLEKRT
ncbi:sterol desaturase family protein [Bacillus sp. 165]|uniref:sterol desaturase family protein n=1 Tax=Bacillus sp. 165 TaxID=1529117 RepID=UPI001ADA639D|nr:sterol desaturase family protein [Bacillus sp. 165]MBO9129355.1 sterol desaturase family protein [Bacillus sp. 165]